MNSIFNPNFSKRFVDLGFPIYLILPLMIAKSLGLFAIWINKSQFLKEWAFSGFFFLFLIALIAEINAENSDYFSPTAALLLFFISNEISNSIAKIKSPIQSNSLLPSN